MQIIAVILQDRYYCKIVKYLGKHGINKDVRRNTAIFVTS